MKSCICVIFNIFCDLLEIYDFIKSKVRSQRSIRASDVKTKVNEVYGTRAPLHFAAWGRRFRKKVASSENTDISLVGQPGCNDFRWCIVGCGGVTAVWNGAMILHEEDDEKQAEMELWIIEKIMEISTTIFHSLSFGRKWRVWQQNLRYFFFIKFVGGGYNLDTTWVKTLWLSVSMHFLSRKETFSYANAVTIFK